MIKIGNNVIKHQKNFWNNCIFHPTDAIEDSWGKRILDRISEDKAIDTVRIYNMFEDIVYIDGNGKIAYDFRVNDLRLDYLVEKGFDVLIAYGFTPECIATYNAHSSVSKNKTRYKGKLINTSMPDSLDTWEDMCYEYTKHIVDRYGIDRVSGWHLQCWNEPDIKAFFLAQLEDCEDPQANKIRTEEYCKLYERFEKALMRVSRRLHIGGPALALVNEVFLGGFLGFVKEKGLRLDYIALHNYSGKGWRSFSTPEGKFSVEDWIAKQKEYQDIIDRSGFSDTEIVVDEWGMASHGYFNLEECPAFIARETEIFSAYYAKLIHEIIRHGIKMEKLMICLSGQHEMVTDFSGFRNFFTLNFIAKPIYNAYVLASRLYDGLLPYSCDNDKICVVPTSGGNGEYAVLATYSGEGFDKNLPTVSEKLMLPGDAAGKTVEIYLIDKDHTNPYAKYLEMGEPEMTRDVINTLRDEGNIKVLRTETVGDDGGVDLEFAPNSLYFVKTI